MDSKPVSPEISVSALRAARQELARRGGLLGGKSRSAKKRAASRRNGRRGGRPKTRK